MLISHNLSQFTCDRSCVTYHMSHVMCNMLCVSCHVLHGWRVCYQQGLPRVVLVDSFHIGPVAHFLVCHCYYFLHCYFLLLCHCYYFLYCYYFFGVPPLLFSSLPPLLFSTLGGGVLGGRLYFFI